MYNHKDYLELVGDDMDDIKEDFMYKPVATGHQADPDGQSWTWQINIWRKNDWGDSMFYMRHADMFDYIDNFLISEDVCAITVYFEGQLHEMYQLLMKKNTWQYTNFQTGAIKIGTPEQVKSARALQGIPTGGWL